MNRNDKYEKQHTNPCGECPWKKTSLRGWLGNVKSPDDWLQVAHGETRVPCHMRCDSAQCAGLATYRANVYKKPRDQTILILPQSDAVFQTPMQFKEHHEVLKGTRTGEHNASVNGRTKRSDKGS